jgi:hypothetical protein
MMQEAMAENERRVSSRLRIGNTSIIIRQHTIHNNIADAMCHPDHIITILSSFYSPTDRGEHVMIAPRM